MIHKQKQQSHRSTIRWALIALISLGISGKTPAADGEARPVRNVIVMIPDGCSQSIQTLARWVKEAKTGQPLHLDGLNTGVVRTHSASSIITDSAAAATAFATGHRTTTRFIGVAASEHSPYYNKTLPFLTGFEPEAPAMHPVASVLEGARLVHKSTGLVATSRVSHATPAGFASHVHDRGMEREIMEQAVYQSIDVVFSGGARYLVPSGSSYKTSFGKEWGGARNDKENLVDVLKERGYQFVDSRETMLQVERGPVWGMFDDDAMDPDLDRDDLHPTQPSLAEMTQKAIEILAQDEDGFFLMVEGSQVDWGGHSNDAFFMLGDFLAFDDAVGTALDFAKADGETLLLVFPDHDTGGLTIGHEFSSFPPSYSSMSIEALIDPVKDANMTLQGLLPRIPRSGKNDAGDEIFTTSDVITAFSKNLGPYWEKQLTSEHAEHITNVLNSDSSDGSKYSQIRDHINRNLTCFGWTSGGHTGVDVPLFAFGPNPVFGTYENTDIAHLCAAAMGFELKAITDRLFVDALAAFPDATIDTSSSENPVLVVNGHRLPVSKDYIELPDGQRRQLEGITVHAPEIEKVFIPRQAVELLKQE